MSYRMLTDENMCIHCKACEVQCKVWNKVPAGLKLGVLLSQGPYMQDGEVTLRALYMPCQHCDNSPCLAACPTGAMRRRKDGIIYVETAPCTGCRSCRMACPWQVPQWDEAAGKMRKCDFCRHRLDAGLMPACVTGCLTKALSFEKEQEHGHHS